jgi:hypothetical protein
VIEKKRKKQKKLIKPRKKGGTMTGGPQGNPATGAAPAPCKISPDPSGQFDFQVKASDLPAKIKLCEDEKGTPAKTSSFDKIVVSVALTDPPKVVPGQPNPMTATGASFTLQKGAYDIVIALNVLPTSMVAYVYEDCGSLNQLLRIPTPVKVTGHFSLEVI